MNRYRIRLRLGPIVFSMALLAWMLGGCSEERDTQTSQEQYNVVLITLDTTRADRLGCYGYSRPTSPHMDALAAEGIRFDLAIAQAASTPVSHASILAGLYPHQHGVRVIYAARGFRLSEDVPTLATGLGAAGWKTGAFLSSFNVSEFFGFNHGFDIFDNGLSGDTGNIMVKGEGGMWGWNVSDNQRRSDATTEQAVAWLSGVKPPFFTWIHYWDPHDVGLVPPNEFVSQFVSARKGTLDWRREMYDAEIAYVDAQFGRLVEALKQQGHYDRTILVIVGDHGQGLGDHGWWAHRLLYQEQIRVPLIIRIPGVPGGKTVSQLVRTIDILPTIYEALGQPIRPSVEGKSLLGLASGKSEDPRLAYADALNLYDLNAHMIRKRPKDDLLYCAMDAEWKLIYRPLHPKQSELFRIAADPKELDNVFDKHPQEVRRLRAYLGSLDAFVDGPFGPADDPDTLKRLRSLGYVGEDDDQ